MNVDDWVAFLCVTTFCSDSGLFPPEDDRGERISILVFQVFVRAFRELDPSGPPERARAAGQRGLLRGAPPGPGRGSGRTRTDRTARGGERVTACGGGAEQAEGLLSKSVCDFNPRASQKLPFLSSVTVEMANGFISQPFRRG